MSFITEFEFYLFLLKLIFSFLLGGLIIASGLQFILKKDRQLVQDPILLLIAGIGLSPYLIGILLNYLLWIVPERTDSFYFISILLCFLVLFLLFRKEISPLISGVLEIISKINRRLILLASLGLVVVGLGWSFYITKKAITEHDTLEYAVQGKIFYETKTVTYDDHNFDEGSGFYYVGLHGYSFPLIASWERIGNSILKSDSDYLFRSINSLYGILILLSIVFFAYRKSGIEVAIALLIALPFAYGFFETIFKYHIDFYRIFFLNYSILGMILLIKRPSTPLLIALGIFLGAQANAHSLGALLYLIQLFVIFLFLPLNLFSRLKYSIGLLSISLFFGSLHYLLDVVWGTGWIFQEIKFY